MRSALNLLMQRSKEKKDGSASHRRSPSARASAKRKHGGEAQGASQQQKGEKQQPQDKVECPLCGSSIALFAINAHMDFACTRRPRRESRDGSGSAAASPEGPAAAAKKAKGRDAVTSPGTAATAAEATVATASAGPSAAAAPPAAPAQSGATKPHQLEHLPEAAAAPPAEAAATPTPTPKMKPVPATQRTGTVHDFFGGQDHTVPGFFVLDTAAQPWRASFERRRPAGAKTVVSTKWMGKDLLLLYAGETSPVATDVSSAVPTHSACYTGQVPLLKSHLQKCVRRCRTRLAVQSARELASLSFSDLVRRLPIIMIEDACLLDWLPTLTWFMVALSKDAIISRAGVAWILGAAHALAACKGREPMMADGDGDGATRFEVTLISKDLKKQRHKDLLYALQIRKNFGGMKGDMRMLNTTAHVWLERFKRVEEQSGKGEKLQGELKQMYDSLALSPVDPIEASIVPPLDVSSWELSGVDFHVSNIGMQMEQTLIWDEVLELAGSTNSAIWTASSGRNEKPLLPFLQEEPPSETTKALLALWDDKVKPLFDRQAHRILATRCRTAMG